MKVCSKCREAKPPDSFARSSRSKDGRQPWCKECERVYRAANAERLRKYQRSYYSQNTEKVKERIRASEAPAQRAAYSRLYSAIRYGKIIRPNACSACGRACTPDAHHTDYSRPLDVEWLCKSCHLSLHGSAQ